MRANRKKPKITQAVILCGGVGSRLGKLTKNSPKSMLKINSTVFLELIFRQFLGHGIREIILLCGFKHAKIFQRFQNKDFFGIKIRCIKETKPLGTGGAIINAYKMLDKYFLLCNGDTYFNFNISEFISKFDRKFDGSIALTSKKKNLRYSGVLLKNGIVKKFGINNKKKTLINTGFYIFKKKIFNNSKIVSISLENNLIPKLVKKKKLKGFKFTKYINYFIDIGNKKDFAKAQSLIPKIVRKRAVFLDRDGVINEDKKYLSEIKNFPWNSGVKKGIKRLNDNNFFVFVITNQAGVGRGYYSEQKVLKLHNWISSELQKIGAYIDYFFYAPYYKYSKKLKYRKGVKLRKPNTGMIDKAIKNWPIELKNSFLIGDKQLDMELAKRVNIKGYLMKNNKGFSKIIDNILASGKKRK